jgi:hypothetical protein
MNRIVNIEQFRAAKQAILTKYGERVVAPTPEVLKTLTVDVAPLVRYSRMPTDRIITALAQTHLGQI